MRVKSPGSWLKIKRAKKHLSDFHEMFVAFSNSNLNTKLSVEEHSEGAKTHSLRVDIDMQRFNTLGDDATLIIGDILHNLKSALDHLYYQTVLACQGAPSDWTRFPVDQTWQGVKSRTDEALKKQQITTEVASLIVNSIKPYEAGNPAIWGLHRMNIVDKHERVIPTLKLVGIFDVSLQDEGGQKIGNSFYIADESCSIPLLRTYGKKIELKSKGSTSANIVFGYAAPIFAGEAVFPSLARVTEEVTRTVEAFKTLNIG